MSIFPNFEEKIYFGEFLRIVKNNPEHYLYEQSLKAIDDLTLGYSICYCSIVDIIVRRGKDTIRITDTFPYFNEFVCEKFSDPSMTPYTMKIDRKYPDFAEAIENLVKLYDEYVNDYMNYLSKGKIELNTHRYYVSAESKQFDNFDANQIYYQCMNLFHRRLWAMITSPYSAKKMKTFLNGFYYCAKHYNVEVDPHPGFYDYIQNKYKGKTGEDAFETLSLNHGGETSAYKFFEHLSEFLIENDMKEYLDIYHRDMEAVPYLEGHPLYKESFS